MKKRVLALLLVGCFVLTACSSKTKTEEVDSEEITEDVTDDSEEDSEEDSAMSEVFSNLTEINGIPIVDEEITASNYVEFLSVGTYKGIKLEKTIAEVTDEDVDTQVSSELASNPIENTDPSAVVEMGDTINLDYSGSIDGVVFDGGTAEGQSLEIGSGAFIDGFEDQMVGMHVGESGEIEVTFPEDYSAEDLAGKDAVFAVTVNSINEYAEEVTEEWLLANTEYTNEEDYRESIREELQTSNETSAENTVKSEAWDTVFNSADFTQYPRKEVEESAQELLSMYEYYASMYGMDLDEFMSQMGYTEETMLAELENYVQMLLVLDYVCYEEECDEDSQTFLDKQTELLNASGYETVDDAVAAGITEWNITATVKNQLVNTLIYDNAIITEVTESAEDTE